MTDENNRVLIAPAHFKNNGTTLTLYGRLIKGERKGQEVRFPLDKSFFEGWVGDGLEFLAMTQDRMVIETEEPLRNQDEIGVVSAYLAKDTGTPFYRK